jgi:hypothetical protein
MHGARLKLQQRFIQSPMASNGRPHHLGWREFRITPSVLRLSAFFRTKLSNAALFSSLNERQGIPHYKMTYFKAAWRRNGWYLSFSD